MTITSVNIANTAEQCLVSVAINSPVGTPNVVVVIDGKAYTAAPPSSVLMVESTIAVEGDSITEGALVPSLGRLNWPLQMGGLSEVFSKGTVHNFALGGDLVSSMVTEYATQAHTVKPALPSDQGYFFLMAGANDIGQSTAAATIYNNLKTIWATARADGFKVFVFTVTPSTGWTVGNGKETIRLALNALIAGDSTLYDGIIRGDLLLPDPANGTYFLDGIHPSPAGSLVLSHAVALALDTFLSYGRASTVVLPLERGSHTIYVQATDLDGTVTTSPVSYVMAYELTDYGIDLYNGDALLDAISPVIHDELLPALPTLAFSCATLLAGTIGVVIRERGLRHYQFTIATVGFAAPYYQYTCKAADSYALTTEIMTLQTAYGAISDAIRLIAPSLNIVDMKAWVGSTVNLISNGTFETNIDGWTGHVGATLSRETAAPLSGTGSLKILNTVGNGQGSIAITTIPGHQYRVTCRAKSTAAAGRGSHLIATTGGDTFGEPVDCSTEATLTLIFTSAAVSKHIIAMLNGGEAGESLVIDSVVCYDLTLGGIVNLLEQTTYPQAYRSIQPVNVIEQLLIQALAQASVRNGNLYVYPLDVSAQTPDYHIQRLDPFTTWQKDADVYGAVVTRYTVKQFPTPSTILTLNDAANWTGTVSNVTRVADTLLPVPSGAFGMLKSVGNCSRTVSTLFRYFDRIRFNWNPVTATDITVSLQQDVNNKLEMIHEFSGQIGAGFILNTGVDPTGTLTKDITLSPVQYVTIVEGMTTANCSYCVTLLDAAGAILWQDVWRSTIGNTFEADVPTSVSQIHQATTVRIEVKDLYLVDGVHYGVQCINCYITVQVWTNVGSHQQVDSNVQYTVPMGIANANMGGSFTIATNVCPIPTLIGSQGYTATVVSALVNYFITLGAVSGQWNIGGDLTSSAGWLRWYVECGTSDNQNLVFFSSSSITVVVTVYEIIQDYEWVSAPFVWSSAFNLFEAIDLAFVNFTRTGNPVNLQTIVFTFTGDNYVDSLVLVTDNPLPQTVRAGTGLRPFIVPDDFGSQAGAQVYADGLLSIVSVAREQYTRDVPLSTDLSVGDTVDGDGTNMTVYAIDYRQDGKTITAGKSMDTLTVRLKEQARRVDALERKG